MPKGRFELPRGYPHYALNVARLPVPPLRLVVRPPSTGPEPTSGLEPETCCLRNNRRTVQGRSSRFNYAMIAPILPPLAFIDVRQYSWPLGYPLGYERTSFDLGGLGPGTYLSSTPPRMGSREAIPAARTGACASRSGSCSRRRLLARSPPLPIRFPLALIAVMVLVATQLASGWRRNHRAAPAHRISPSALRTAATSCMTRDANRVPTQIKGHSPARGLGEEPTPHRATGHCVGPIPQHARATRI